MPHETKLGVWDRWLSSVYMPTCSGFKLDHIYEAMYLLHEHIERVERHIFFQTANLFNLKVDLIFYNTTTSLHVDKEDDGQRQKNATLRKLGRSKERTWSPQVVVALAVSREGIPVRSWVLAGNTPSVSTIKQIRTDLRGWHLGSAMFVADAGMNLHTNRHDELSRACAKCLLVCRMANVTEIESAVLTKCGPYTVIRENL